MYPATVPLRWLDGFVGLWCGGTILIGVRVLGELIDVARASSWALIRLWSQHNISEIKSVQPS